MSNSLKGLELSSENLKAMAEIKAIKVCLKVSY